MQWGLLTLALGAQSANGYLRFSCSQLTIDRIDP